ncbi:Cytochrome c oxidase subunit 4 [Pseudocyphellaria aurata]|nr:Cytochrome c oxidase subunit 4 [Pseudocyphellaria aurata]
MLLRRSAIAFSRRAAITPIRRSFSLSIVRREEKSPQDVDPQPDKPVKRSVPFHEVKTMEDLLPPGAEPGTIPTDLEQATGLERLEILGKMEGVDVFDMRPLDASRMGTLDNPIMVNSFGNEQYAGCTGYPADSHWVVWLVLSRDRPVGRCTNCGNVLKMNYVGPPGDPHEHYEGKWEEPKSFADYVRLEYR